MRLKVLLLLQTQGDREEVELFLEWRHLLARRLQPHASEADVVALLVEGLKESIRRHLHSPAPNTVEEFITLAIPIEHDERSEQAAQRRSQSPSVAPTKPGPTPQERKGATAGRTTLHLNNKGLPKCRFCPDFHCHKDCTSNLHQGQQGNWHRAGASVSGPAPTTSSPQNPTSQ